MIWLLRGFGFLSVFLLASAFVFSYSSLTTLGEAKKTQQISVPARPMEVVCPGSLYQLGGEDGTEVDSIDALGDADFYLIENGVPTPYRASEPALFTAAEEGQSSAVLSGYQWQRIQQARIAGLVSLSCKKPITEAWMLGGKTNLGSESLLIIHNPDVLSTILDLKFFDGEEQFSDSTSLAPGETKVINLARYVSTDEAVGLNIKSQGGRFAAWVQSKTNSGVSPTGVDIEAHNNLQKDPSMIFTAQSDELPREDRTPTLNVLSPEPISSTVSISSLQGGFGDAFRVDLEAGVSSIELPSLEPGSYRITLEAEAALLSARTNNPLIPDFFVNQSEDPISGEIQMVAVIDGTIEIAAVEDSVASLRITRAGDTELALIGEVSSQKMLTAEVSQGDVLKIKGDALFVRVKNDATAYVPADNSNIGSDLELAVR
jgi:hypothetical protein